MMALRAVANSSRLISVKHEKAHVGSPWNELADSVAKSAEKGTMRLRKTTS